MTSGRQRKILGKTYLINLSNNGGVRKSPGTNAHAICTGREISENGLSLSDASRKCKKSRGTISPKKAKKAPITNMYGLYKKETGERAKVGRYETHKFREWKSKR